MSKHYDEHFKREIAKEYVNGASVKELHEKYGVKKTSIYDWFSSIYGKTVNKLRLKFTF